MTYNPFAQLGQAVSAQQALDYQQALQAQAFEEKPRFAFDPKNPAWDASISTISDLWLAKFGNEWVSEDVLNNDTFFSIAATRLYKLNRLEKHNVPDRFHSVYRIVE
jgi:hypothetical protein